MGANHDHSFNRLSRRAIQRRFSPGVLGVRCDVLFTVVGWSVVEAVEPVPPLKRGRPASWEALIMVNDRLECWDWGRLQQALTFDEWAALPEPTPP